MDRDMNMTKNLNTFRLWREMKTPALRRLALAVFLLFGVLGPLSTLMESALHLVSWRFIIIQTVASGGMAASIVYLSRRGWWVVVLSVAFWTAVLAMHSGTLSFVSGERGLRVVLGKVETQSPRSPGNRETTISQENLDAIYSQRALMGALAIGLLASGYALFLGVVSREVRLRTRLETEVTIAQNIQQSLLPSTTHESSFAEVSGLTVPATEVGGDFFDIVELPGPKLALAIADVTGHGVGPGILSAMTKSALRSQLQHEHDPAQLLQNLNVTIFQVSSEKMFVTFAYLLVDPSNGTVRYATAGHPPILMRDRGGEVHQLRTVNLGLGIKESVQFTAGEFQFSQGTAVLLYTDGVLEVANKKGEQFGTERLTEAFSRARGSPRDTCNGIISEVRGFQEGSPQADDISLMCLTLKA
jgi:serine phosphatase RsbU (regulator of sigma subunit)